MLEVYMSKRQGLSLNELAYREINKLIVSLELTPGTQVDERSLAERLSIGRTPIREALFRLAAVGLIETIPKRGFFVKPITIEDVRALFESLILQERNCAFLAALRINEGQIDELAKHQKHFKEATKNKDYLQVTLLNSYFHGTLYDSIGNHFLSSALHNLQNQAQRLAYLSYSRSIASQDIEKHLKKVNQDHEEIISFAINKEQEKLITKVSEHVRLFHSRIIQYLTPPNENLFLLQKTDTNISQVVNDI